MGLYEDSGIIEAPRGTMNKQDLIDFERHLADRFDAGEMPYLVHFSGGNEDQLIRIFHDVAPGDWIFSTHRSHYHYLLAGGYPQRLEELILSGRSMFVFDSSLNFYASSIVCGTAAIAAGVAWALKRQGSKAWVWCFLGDGAEDEGHLIEAARYVDGWGLPCTYVIEDNDRSVSASKGERWGAYRAVDATCIERYSYAPTWPHGGSGSGKMIQFQCEAQLQRGPQKQWLSLPTAGEKGRKYKDAVKESMEWLAREIGAIFVGYNVRHGSAYETLRDIPEEQRLETPLAENLMAGLAMGMSLAGERPVLYFERHDFIWNALDALVNQLDKIETLSGGQFTMPVIIKAVAGSVKPFYAGLTHTSDLTGLFDRLFSFPVLAPRNAGDICAAYRMAAAAVGPILVSESKELY